MIAMILAAVCLKPPLFAMDGPACADQTVECGCSECMTWLPSATAEWYEVLRANPDGTTQNVGTAPVYRGYTDEDGVVHPAVPQLLWCFARDVSFPIEGRTYSYRVAACRAGAIPPCGAWSADPVVYVAGPYLYCGGPTVPTWPCP